MGDGRPRGDATLKACVAVSLQILRHGPYEYSLPGSFSAHWEQVLSRHRYFMYILSSIRRFYAIFFRFSCSMFYQTTILP